MIKGRARLGPGHALHPHLASGLVRIRGSAPLSVGQGEPATPAMRGASRLGTNLTDDNLYPFQFWPPPAVFYVGPDGNGGVGISMVLTCPTNPWPTTAFPFDPNAIPTLPVDPMNPCNTSPVSTIQVGEGWWGRWMCEEVVYGLWGL